MEAGVPVMSCYEARRDGFWIHRQLEQLGICNRVVDAGRIEVSRRVKTDRLDARALLEKLMRYEEGDRRVWSVVKVPPKEWEDLRQLHRERGQLLGERARHRNRLTSKLVAQGVRMPVNKDFVQWLEEVRLFDGDPLPEHLKVGVRREWARLQLVEEQLRELEGRMRELIQEDERLQAARALMWLTGVDGLSVAKSTATADGMRWVCVLGSIHGTSLHHSSFLDPS